MDKKKKKESSFTAGGNVNWYSHRGKQYGRSSKRLSNAAADKTLRMPLLELRRGACTEAGPGHLGSNKRKL